MTPTELAEVREALKRCGLDDMPHHMHALGVFTDFLMRRPQGLNGSIDQHGAVVADYFRPAHQHPNPLVALARAVNATESKP